MVRRSFGGGGASRGGTEGMWRSPEGGEHHGGEELLEENTNMVKGGSSGNLKHSYHSRKEKSNAWSGTYLSENEGESTGGTQAVKSKVNAKEGTPHRSIRGDF